MVCAGAVAHHCINQHSTMLASLLYTWYRRTFPPKTPTHSHITNQNRYQKLRKKAGLIVTDAVQLYYQHADAATAGGEAAAAEGAALLQKILAGHAPFFSEVLYQQLKPVSEMPSEQQVVAQEVVSVGGSGSGGADDGAGAGATFTAVIAAAPGSSALRLLAKNGVDEMSLA